MKLIIDGSFFAQRIRNALNLNFIDKPKEDEETFIQECSSSLQTQVQFLSNSVDQIIIAKDYGSWRKSVNLVSPKGYFDEDSDQYKDNRDKIEKDYDEDAFYKAYNKWIDLLETKLNVVVVSVYNAEADDICSLLAKAFEMQGMYSILWSSDGDYIQNITDKITLFKLPKRQLYVNNKSNIFRVREAFDIFGKNDNLETERLLGNFNSTDIIKFNPMFSLFTKLISDDSKDNIPPIFYWKVGNRTYKPSNRHFISVGKELNIDFSEDITEDYLYDFDKIKTVIEKLIVATKQVDGVDFTKMKNKGFKENVLDVALQTQEYKDKVESALNVYKSNLVLKHLSPKQIPKDIQKLVFDEYNNKNKKQDINNFLDLEKMLKIMNFKKTEKNDYFNDFNLEQYSDNLLDKVYRT